MRMRMRMRMRILISQVLFFTQFRENTTGRPMIVIVTVFHLMSSTLNGSLHLRLALASADI